MKDRYRRDVERARRHEQKRERLRNPHPVCVICGSMNLLALIPVSFLELPASIQRRVLEKHHPAGRSAEGGIVILCLNCHGALSDAQYDWDERLRHPQTRNQRMAAYLRGLADMFRQEGTTRSTQADELEAMADELMSPDASTD